MIGLVSIDLSAVLRTLRSTGDRCIDLSLSEILSGLTRCIRAECMITNCGRSIMSTAQCSAATGAIYMEMVATTCIGVAWETMRGQICPKQT